MREEMRKAARQNQNKLDIWRPDFGWSRADRRCPALRPQLRTFVPVVLLATLFYLTFASRAIAQSEEGAAHHGNEFSFHGGYLLPNQIDGVTEILPVVGARYGFAMGEAGVIELGAANSHAEGVDFTTFTLSLRGEVPLIEGITGIVYGGTDFNWYQPQLQSERLTAVGVHLGAGGMMLVSDTLWLRTEMKFMGGPGTSLYLGFGLVFRASSGGN